MDGDNVRVIESGEGLRLALEALEPLLVRGELGGQDLQSHLTLERRVLCSVHLSHPARTEFLQDLVVAQRLANHVPPPEWFDPTPVEEGTAPPDWVGEGAAIAVTISRRNDSGLRQTTLQSVCSMFART